MKQEPVTSKLARRGSALLAMLFLATTVVSLAYFVRERDRAEEAKASRDQAQAANAQNRAQMDQLTARINSLAAAAAAQQAAAQAQAQAASQARRSASVARFPARRPANDPRLTKLQAQLAENQKDLAGTKEDLKKAREELQGKLDSTRDELNGSIARNHDELSSSMSRSHDELSTSIARNHDELVELQKRGERNYYEFDLAKSKQFQRTGPLSLSLRNADVKHKRYDMMMLVDDAQLEKKRVNAFEPVMVYLPDRAQPVELVVNQIDKNHIKGYVSEPKYKKADLVRTSAAPKPQQLTPRP